MKSTPNILLINPWICDFAAYDLWMKPLGLLYLGGLLIKNGYSVRLVDCLNMDHPGMKSQVAYSSSEHDYFGARKLYKEILPVPSVYGNIHRHFGRYGITEKIFREMVVDGPKPKVILVTSMMTYWYPGVFDAIRIIKEIWPDVPVVLGGIYATLCSEHAKSYSGADHVITGEGETQILNLCDHITGHMSSCFVDPQDLESFPRPAWELMSPSTYACLLTSRGCPFHCNYCAHDMLAPGYRRRSWMDVFNEMEYSYKKGIRTFVFYDDALLITPEKMIIPLMEEVIKRNWEITFHTPNGLHVREITPDVASLMYRSGFKTIRISLESNRIDIQKASDLKATNTQFIMACQALHQAGFSTKDIGVYLLAMLPGQHFREVEEAIRFVISNGAYPYLCEYTPIPGTPMFNEALKYQPLLSEEPLLQNNSAFPCSWDCFTKEDLDRLKHLRRDLINA